MIDRLDVHIELDGRTHPAGTAYFVQRRGGPVATTFAYSVEYLANPTAISIDPNLPLVSGQQATNGMPGAFQDCAPDRWGRNLILKRSRTSVSAGDRTPALNDADFLAVVSDITRQGALRFSLSGTAEFIDAGLRVPKLIALPRLLYAVDRLADDDESDEAVKVLLDAGSGSLGGARPKASVLDNGRLLLAKFPHRSDGWDVMGWEKTALDIAGRAGINVPGRRLVGLDGRQILLLERFDRDDQHRIAYISAMTLVGGRIGEDYDYADIAATLPDFGSRVAADLDEMFRRVVVSCAIHNTDDHFLNHGFLGSAAGWKLAPVFDINPNPDLNEGRVTSIAAASRAEDEPAGLIAVAGDFRLTESAARSIVTEVVDAVADWADIATANGISAREREQFRPMFNDRIAALASTALLPRPGPARAASTTQRRVPKGSPTAGQFAKKDTHHP